MIRKLDYYKDLPSEKLVKIDLDYGTIVRRLNDMKFNMPVYLCKGNQILFSNVGYSGNRTQFSYLPDKIKIDKKYLIRLQNKFKYVDYLDIDKLEKDKENLVKEINDLNIRLYKLNKVLYRQRVCNKILNNEEE